MRLDLRFPAVVAALPLPADALLHEHKGTAFENAALKLRHPLAIYNVSLTSITAEFQALLPLLAKPFEYDEKTLVRQTDSLLDAVMEHFDDCENIIKVFFYTSGEKVCGNALREFRAIVRECRDFVAKQVNKIKHEQARLRLLHVDSPGIRILGYFVEGVLPDGAIGPHPDIHAGGDGAYSYVRCLRYLLCTVVFASRALCTVMREKCTHRVDVDHHGIGSLLPVADDIGKLGDRVLFDEELVTPIVALDSKRLVLGVAPNLRGGRAPDGNVRVNVTLGGDGVTNKFKIPYLATQRPAFKVPFTRF